MNIRSLALSALTAGFLSQACTIKSSDDSGSGGRALGSGGATTGSGGAIGGSGGNAVPASGRFGLTWEVGGAATTCGTGWYVDIDVREASTFADYHDSFSCTELQGVTVAFPTGIYAVAARLRDGSGAMLSDTTLPDSYTLAAGSQLDLGHIIFQVAAQPIPDQYVSLSWTIYQCADTGCTSLLPGELSCAEAGADWVILTVDQAEYWFSCADKAGVTPTIAAGSHVISVELQDWWNTTLSSLPAATTTVVAGTPLELPVQFSVY